MQFSLKSPIQQGKLNFSTALDSVLRKCLNPFREFSWADTRWLEGSVYVTWSQCSPQLCTSRCTAVVNGIPQRFVSVRVSQQHRWKPRREVIGGGGIKNEKRSQRRRRGRRRRGAMSRFNPPTSQLASHTTCIHRHRHATALRQTRKTNRPTCAFAGCLCWKLE